MRSKEPNFLGTPLIGKPPLKQRQEQDLISFILLYGVGLVGLTEFKDFVRYQRSSTSSPETISELSSAVSLSPKATYQEAEVSR